MNRYFLFLFLVWSSLFQLNAQNSYQLSGKVIDRTTKEPLFGASVFIEGARLGSNTDLKGNYAINGIREARVKVIVVYIGYDSDTIAYRFTERNRGKLNINLTPTSIELNQVVVTGQSEGQAGALREQKIAANIKNIVASDQIERFPDLNAAEAISRVPGITLQRDQGEGRYVQLRGTAPELSNFLVNGIQIPAPEGDIRYVALDIVAVDQLERIEITKALTPDMDGDGIGGSVNLVTRRAKDSIPEINAVIAGGYNNIVQDYNAQAQFSYGQRNNKLGVYLNGSYNLDNRGSHNIEYQFDESRFAGDTTFRIHYDDVQLRHYTITRERIGLSATFDYQFNPQHKIYIGGLYNGFSDQEYRRRARFNIGSGFLTSETSSREAKIERDLKNRLKVQTIANYNLGGEHDFGGFVLDYDFAYAKAVEEIPDRVDINFENDLVNLELDLTEPNWPRITFPRESDSLTVRNLEDYEFEEMLLLEGRTTDKNLTGRVNVKIPYNIGNQEGFFKFGGLTRTKDKERNNVGQVYHKYFQLFAVNNVNDSIRQIYSLAGPELSLATVYDGFTEPNLLNRDYDLGPTPDPELVDNFIEFYRQNFKLEENDTKEESHSEDFFAEEDIYAAYGMFQHQIDRLMILGGVRYERTDIRYQGFDVQFREFSDAFDRIDTLRQNRQYEFILPQFHLKYSLNNSTNFRAAYTHSFSRPNFEDILPYRQVEYDSREITQGNPDLLFAEAINIDLLAEKYLPNRGLLSGGLFYKRIENFVYYFEQRTFLEDLSRSGWYFLTTAENGLEAFVYGAEVTWNQQFSFLPDVWKNFGIYFNYTYTHSDAYIDKRTEQRERIPLPGQAEHVANIALFYESPKFYAKLAANYQDAFLDELGIQQEWDVYYDQNWHLDFNANYSITKNIKVYVNAINLTNTPLRFYMGREDRVKQQEYYSWWGRAGVKVQL